ncbi:hypothetical protein [Pseudovibrio flavus]|nr:hypothetical protein [Pseudovibrio flavus]
MSERTLYIGFGVFAGILLLAAGSLWMHYGSFLFADRVINALAGCF